MNLKSVNSSRISEVGWNNNTMYVKFKNNRIYAYYNVNYEEYIRFINSPSLGKALDIFDKIHDYNPI